MYLNAVIFYHMLYFTLNNDLIFNKLILWNWQCYLHFIANHAMEGRCSTETHAYLRTFLSVMALIIRDWCEGQGIYRSGEIARRDLWIIVLWIMRLK